MTQNRIREFRKKHRYSQRQLGEAIGVAQTTVAGWENGARAISLDMLRRISTVLQEPLSNLVDDVTREKAQSAILEMQKQSIEIGLEPSTGGDLSDEVEDLLFDEEYDEFERISHALNTVLKGANSDYMRSSINDNFDLLNDAGRYQLYLQARLLTESGFYRREED